MEGPQTFRIFVSYRREDGGHAGRLYDVLSSRFGHENVFMDVDAIEPGVDFAETITRAVASCNAVLAVIGREWLTAGDAEGRRRLDDPHDWVRLELERALALDVVVIPTCVQGARVPVTEDLPPSLAAFARRQGIELRDVSWRDDTERLIRWLERLAGREDVEETTAVPRAQPQPARWRSKWWLVALGLGAAVLAAIVAVVALSGGGDGESADARRLISLVPEVTRPSCEPITWGEESALASVECNGKDLTVQYSLFPNNRVASGWYVQQRVGKVNANTGACTPKSMHGEHAYVVLSATVGRLFCYLNGDRLPRIVWTDLRFHAGADAHMDEGTGPRSAKSLLEQRICCLQLEPPATRD